jgi:signal peptidase II
MTEHTSADDAPDAGNTTPPAEPGTPSTPAGSAAGRSAAGESAAGDGAVEAATTGGRGARRGLLALLAGTAVAVVVVDQLSKAWAVEGLTGRGRVDLVGELFGLRLTRNPGAAFSLATGSTWIFTILASIVVVVIARIARDLGSRWWAVTLGLLMGGATGNLADRLFRAPGFARGHVVDFFELPHYPIFNVADSCIVTAAVLIGWLGLRGIGVNGERAQPPSKPSKPATAADRQAST